MSRKAIINFSLASIDRLEFAIRLLQLLSLILAVSVVYRWVASPQKLFDFTSPVKLTLDNSKFFLGTTWQPNPFNYYAARWMQRDPFLPLDQRVKTGEKNAVTAAEALNQERLRFSQDLKLVGIVLDKTAQAIIEDHQAGKTFFVHPGESLRGARVEEIREGLVILQWNGQRIEIRHGE